MNTTAIVIPKAETIELQEVVLKPLGPGDVLVRTRLTSISAGTERMLLRGVMPHPMLQFPVVPGYETVGEVIETGPDAASWLGRRVYVGGNYGFVGVNPAFGGQSAHIVAPVGHLTPIDSVSDQQGVMLALAATALHGVDLAFGGVDKRADGQRWAVLGQGVVGQLAARIARSRGAHITVTDKIAARLAIAQADIVIDTSAGAAPPEALKDLDGIIDATGKMEAIAPLLMGVKKGGRVLLLGYYDSIALPYQPVFLRELSLVSSMQWGLGDLVRARDLLASGSIDVAPLLTHTLPHTDAVQAFQTAFHDASCVKMLLTWN